MRRMVPLIVIASLLGAACASSDTVSTDSVPETAVSSEPASEDTDDGGESTDTTGDSVLDGEPEDFVEDIAPTTTSPDKPTDINVPGAAPDALVVTTLTEGAGPESAIGDTVIVDYVGVRSLDGEEFDNSYDRGTPFAVGPLGSAQVIQGWNDGLIGVQAGAQLQLDIPSDLAYGEAARSDVIRENEPLTFVIDVRSVIKQPDPADAPTESGVESSAGATELSFEDLIEGDGAVLEEGQTAVFNLVLFRADNGSLLDSTWETEPIQIPMDASGFPALVQGMPGMKVGGRRAITAPPALAFGDAGNPQIGLPADTDVVIVIDLFGAY